MSTSGSDLRDLLSGRRTGAGALALRFLLLAGVPLYRLALALRGLAYTLGLKRVGRPAVPVVSVGNLTAGGTGKSPFVAHLVSRLASLGVRPGVVSRGYRSRDGELGDEGRELLAALPETIRVEDPDRVRGSAEAVTRGAEAIVLDDAFQHRACARDLDVVLIDATEPFGYGYLLPRGLLREPLSALRRADVLVLTRTDQVSPEAADALERRLRSLAPDAALLRARHAPTALLALADGSSRPPEELDGRPVAAFSGIGNPAAFEATLGALGADVVASVRRPDHHDHDSEDLEAARARAREAGAVAVVTTTKDAVKLTDADGDPPVWVLHVAMEILANEEALTDLLLERIVRGRSDG